MMMTIEKNYDDDDHDHDDGDDDLQIECSLFRLLQGIGLEEKLSWRKKDDGASLSSLVLGTLL